MALEGVADLTKQLDALGKLEDGKALRRGVAAGGRVVVARAKALIPKGVDAHRTYKGRLVAPGFASRSIRSVTSLSKDKQKATVKIGVRNEAFYAVNFVEIGTSKMPRQPWLRPAFQSTLDAQQKALADSLRKSILQAAKK